MLIFVIWQRGTRSLRNLPTHFRIFLHASAGWWLGGSGEFCGAAGDSRRTRETTSRVRETKETAAEAQVGVSWPEALIIAVIVVVNVRHCAANGLWILRRSFRGSRRVGAARSFLRALRGLGQVYERVNNDRRGIPDEYWKFSGFTRFRLPEYAARRIYGLLFSARRILRMPTPRRTAGVTLSTEQPFAPRSLAIRTSRCVARLPLFCAPKYCNKRNSIRKNWKLKPCNYDKAKDFHISRAMFYPNNIRLRFLLYFLICTIN